MNPQVEEKLKLYQRAKQACEDAISVRESIAIDLAEAVASAPPEEPAPPTKKPRKKAPPNLSPIERKPNPDNAAKKYADYEPASSGCLCGCGEDATGDFLRGHDKRLKSIVGAVDADKLHFSTIPEHALAYVEKLECSDGLKTRCAQASIEFLEGGDAE